MTSRLLRCVALGAVLAVRGSALAAQQLPSTAVGVLQRMHDAYAGTWYHTLTFWQTTTMYRPTGVVEQRWYESLRYTPATGTQLRIDMGEPAAGNGVLDTSDSGWTMRNGTLADSTASGNPFLPIIEGVYVQPVSLTARQFAAMHIDTTRLTSGSWQGQPVWIVGAATPTDTMSSQVWIDPVKLVAVRVLVVLVPNRPPFDIHLDEYARVGKGWLATRVSMFVGGKPRQVEQYHDWKAGGALDPGLFSPATWTTAKHWKH